MFSGIMMTAIYKTVDGHAGLAGWRWVRGRVPNWQPIN
jgi:hypothetical protein